jgi:hypothetical protein
MEAGQFSAAVAAISALTSDDNGKIVVSRAISGNGQLN